VAHFPPIPALPRHSRPCRTQRRTCPPTWRTWPAVWPPCRKPCGQASWPPSRRLALQRRPGRTSEGGNAKHGLGVALRPSWAAWRQSWRASSRWSGRRSEIRAPALAAGGDHGPSGRAAAAGCVEAAADVGGVAAAGEVALRGAGWTTRLESACSRHQTGQTARTAGTGRGKNTGNGFKVARR